MVTEREAASVRYGRALPSEAPLLHRPGACIFFVFSAPLPFFTTKILLGPIWGMAEVGPWRGVGAGKGEKSAPPEAGERAMAGNFAGGLGFMGPRRPSTEH